MMMIDSHCHLDLVIERSGKSCETIIQDAITKGVSKIIIPGLHPQQWRTIQKLCEVTPNLYFAVGIHPWWIHQISREELQQIQHEMWSMAQHPQCIAIGETGLDAHIETAMNIQIEVLHMHLQLANQVKKPVILHSRQTDHLLLQQLKKIPLDSSGVVHGFTGHIQVARSFIQHGLYLAAGGSITYPRARKTIQTFTEIPLDRIILETDAPDMPLQGFQGQVNLPEYVPEIAQCLADHRQEPVKNIISETFINTQKLFQLQNTEPRRCN